MPQLGVDVRIAALVGMAAIFAGASRALLASAIFAFETTLQPLGLLPLLGGCTASFLVSCLLMKHSIMTEKIARRGIRAPDEYLPDLLNQIYVRDVALRSVVSLPAEQSVGQTVKWFESGVAGARHQGFPVLEPQGLLIGVLTRRDFFELKQDDDRKLREIVHRLPCYVYDDCTLRQAADHMVRHDVGRLPVLSREKPPKLIGLLTRSDILSAYRRWLEEGRVERPVLRMFAGLEQ
jgi:CBS domain-containing protein